MRRPAVSTTCGPEDAERRLAAWIDPKGPTVDDQNPALPIIRRNIP